MKELQHYVLFPNHDSGMRLKRELKALDIRAIIAPTPRAASKCCGISLMIEEADIEAVQKCVEEHDINILEIVALEKNINPNRDRYC